MIFLFLTVLSSSAIALILKYNASRQSSTLQMLAANYLTASGLALVRILLDTESQSFSLYALFFGAAVGILFAAGFFVFAQAVLRAGTAMATTASRLSVMIPILLSVLFFAEMPHRLQYAGFALTLLTIFFFYLSLRSMGTGGLHSSAYFSLSAVTLLMGLGDFAMKLFKESSPAATEGWMLFFIFSSALLIISTATLRSREAIDPKAVLNGFMLGVPNMFSSYFLLAALARLPAVLVYPFVNIGIILITSLAAWLIWGEGLNRWGRIALISGMSALIFLGIH